MTWINTVLSLSLNQRTLIKKRGVNHTFHCDSSQNKLMESVDSLPQTVIQSMNWYCIMPSRSQTLTLNRCGRSTLFRSMTLRFFCSLNVLKPWFNLKAILFNSYYCLKKTTAHWKISITDCDRTVLTTFMLSAYIRICTTNFFITDEICE